MHLTQWSRSLKDSSYGRDSYGLGRTGDALVVDSKLADIRLFAPATTPDHVLPCANMNGGSPSPSASPNR